MYPKNVSAYNQETASSYVIPPRAEARVVMHNNMFPYEEFYIINSELNPDDL